MSARFVGISLLLALLVLGLSFVSGQEGLMLVALFFVALMIPLGTMFNPPSKKGRKQTVAFTIGILIAGLVGCLMKLTTGSDLGIIIAFAGIFIYQWVLNGIMIRAGARRMKRD